MGSVKIIFKSLFSYAPLLALLTMTACSSAPTHDPRGFVPNSAFGNANPAPKNMSPPDVDGDKQVIDEMQMHTQADYHFSLGETFSLDGDSKRAVEEFKLTTVYDPKSATVRLRLANEFLKMGLLTESMEQAELAEKLDSTDLEVQMFLGGLYTAMKMYNQAMDHYQIVYSKDPKNQEAPIFIGLLYAEQEKYDEAEKFFMKAAGPDNEKSHLAYYYIGKMRAEQSEPNVKAAEQAYSKCMQIKPDFEEGVIALYDLYVQEKHREKGIKLLESFEEQFGPKKSVAYQLSQAYLESEDFDHAFKHLRTLESFEPTNLNVKVKIALILIEKKHYNEAIDKLEEIMAIAPGSDKIRFYLAAVYEETQHTELAINNYLKIESTSTYYADAIVHAAFLYRKKQDLKTAEEIMQKAIVTRNDVAQFYAFYASLLDETKEFKRGIDMLQGAVKKFPENTQLHFYLGSLYDRVNKTDDAVTEMRRILAIDADYVQALNYLAFTFADQGKNLEEAETLGRKAMNLQPNDAYILDTVGWVLFKKGRTEESIQYLEAAYKLKMEESVIAEHLGDAYYVFELNEKAKDMYLKAAATENDPAKVSKIKAKIANITATHERKPASVSGP
jgi:tetratricopeptide (TPR) repeat protein